MSKKRSGFPWICSNCFRVNEGWVNTCPRCGKERPKSEGGEDAEVLEV